MIRTVDFRYIVQRDGADLSELIPAAGSSPSVRMNDTGAIKTSFSGSFLDPGDEIDWMTDQIRPEMIVDGVVHPLGIYLPATVGRSETDTAKTIRIEAYDRCWQVKTRSAENQIYFAAGLNYLSAVGSLISEAGITMISAEETDAVLAEGREDWAVGTPNLDIVNQLLGEINYKQLWFDARGVARLEPVKQATAANIDHVLDDTKIESMLSDTISRDMDAYNAPNVFLCICSNADKAAPMVAKAENTNPESPLSISRRGRRITQVVQVDNIASQAALQVYANRLVTDSMMSGETIRIQTALLPGFGVGDVVALRYGGLLALAIERSWNMSLSTGGKMQHTLEKVMMNLD